MMSGQYDSIELYWRDIKDAKPLSREDEVRYFKLARGGDEAARQKLVCANLRFVVSVARDYKDYGLSLVELVSEGNVGLMEAIKRFDEIVAQVDISIERTRNALEVSQQDVSLDAPAFLEEETTLVQVFVADQEGIDDCFERTEMEEAVTACLQVLDPRESQVVRAYFGLDNARPRTLEEIGDSMGVTRERVRQLRNRALDKIRRKYGDRLTEFSRN